LKLQPKRLRWRLVHSAAGRLMPRPVAGPWPRPSSVAGAVADVARAGSASASQLPSWRFRRCSFQQADAALPAAPGALISRWGLAASTHGFRTVLGQFAGRGRPRWQASGLYWLIPIPRPRPGRLQAARRPFGLLAVRQIALIPRASSRRPEFPAQFFRLGRRVDVGARMPQPAWGPRRGVQHQAADRCCCRSCHRPPAGQGAAVGAAGHGARISPRCTLRRPQFRGAAQIEPRPAVPRRSTQGRRPERSWPSTTR